MPEANVDQITSDLMQLPAVTRIEIAERLMGSVGNYASDEIATQWNNEIERRVLSVEQGEVEGIPSEDAFREARRRLNERGQRQR